ncbi:protein-S-isoprenylcysteine O-methyltransferase [Teratosphaeria destructans]|uniref:Protein-S-isoprenylcysteine O-methyltransferase n=1 Tax=Teratosphaeria destructans TaxID=418781 RepID=A0A9W7W5P4_9PEZI|nr:protein-S-isoprenylcysteine O-methyltransferase [Teratosphaeria destructans]
MEVSFSLPQAALASAILAATAGTYVSLTPPHPNRTDGTTKDSLSALGVTDKRSTILALSPMVILGLHQSSLAYCYPIVPTSLLGFGLENGINSDLIKWTPSTAVPLAAILCIGVPLRLIPYGTLGKNFTFRLAEPDRLTTTGIYRYVQHPSYTGLLALSLSSLALFSRPDGVLACWVPPRTYEYVPWCVSCLLPAGVISLLAAIRTRVREEEQMLRGKFGREWEEWHARTARFIPWII